MKLNWTILCKSALCFSALATLVASAQADPINLVQNGGFEQTTLNQSAIIGPTSGQSVIGWTNPINGNNGAFNYVILPGQGDTAPVAGHPDGLLYGPGNGVNNGLPATSPSGGNYVALDASADYNNNFYQNITGLIPGQSYTLTFDYAGRQATGFNGPTREGLQVSLGSQTQTTPTLSNTSHGFTGWQTDTMTFTATDASEVLSFLAVGTPSGVPPISLLDGISLTEVTPTPEPASLALLGMGLLGIGGLARLLRKTSASNS